MAGPSQLVASFGQALCELATVEKKHIVLLTEVAKDALRTEPHAAPSLAALICNRILQAPPPQKLPSLYLLDSISKLVGEPYKTLFATQLPEAFMCAWHAGGPGLHRPLDKLLGTWAGVYPQPLLADIAGRLAAARAAAAPAAMQPPALPAGGYAAAGGYGFAATTPAPMAADPRLTALQQPPLAQQPRMPQQPPYGMPLPQPAAYGSYPPAAPQPQQPGPYQQPPYAAAAPAAQAQQPNVTDLLGVLMSAGLLAGPGAPQLQQAGGAALLPHGGHATPPHSLEREQPASTTFTPDRLKELNPSALARLLRQTEATKSRFLDRKFLRRQQKAAGASARASRFWYLDLDTWQASTTGAAPGGAAGGAAGAAAGSGTGGRDAQQVAQQAALATQKPQSVPVDDSQTHCALSGEQFEQFWDEGHQEWRYRDATVLDAAEAARYGLQEGAIVLVSALGQPAASVLQAPGAGGAVLADLAARQEIAADLAALTEEPQGGAADAKQDVKPALVSKEDADAAAAAAAAAIAAGAGAEEAQLPAEKRQRVA